MQFASMRAAQLLSLLNVSATCSVFLFRRLIALIVCVADSRNSDLSVRRRKWAQQLHPGRWAVPRRIPVGQVSGAPGWRRPTLPVRVAGDRGPAGHPADPADPARVADNAAAAQPLGHLPGLFTSSDTLTRGCEGGHYWCSEMELYFHNTELLQSSLYGRIFRYAKK
jgi:hypothetical protein